MVSLWFFVPLSTISSMRAMASRASKKPMAHRPVTICTLSSVFVISRALPRSRTASPM